MTYADVWLKPDWMETFISYRVAGFDESTAVLFIDAGVPHSIVLERLSVALHRTQ
jgi:hypothetical protein